MRLRTRGGTGALTTRMFLGADGNVGIGTIDPLQPLSVATSAQSRIAKFFNDGGHINDGTGAGYGGINV